MAAFLDGCRFNPAAGGTADWTYASAVTGYQSPAAANAVNGATYSYRAESTDLSQWELGKGTYNTSMGVLARTTILYSSASNAKVGFSTVPQVAIVALAEDLISVDAPNSLTAPQQEQVRANIGCSVGVPDVIIEEQQPSGTNGGTATLGSWFTRALNTSVRNFNSIASLASNQVTLGPGTYFLRWSAPGYLIGQHKTQILNVTDSIVVGNGTTEYSQPNSAVDSCMTSSVGSAVVAIAGSKTFALQHRVTATRGTNGLGAATGFGVSEVYSRLEITKIG